MAFTGKGERLAALTNTGEIVSWDIATGAFLSGSPKHPSLGNNAWIGQLILSADGSLLALVAANFDVATKKVSSQCSVFALPAGKLSFALPTLAERVSFAAVAFSPDGKLLAVAANYGKSKKNGSVRFFETASGKELKPLQVQREEARVTALAFAPAGDTLAVATAPRDYYSKQLWQQRLATIEVWDLPSARLCRQFTDKNSQIHTLVFSPDGATLASGSWDTTLLLWDTSGLAK
jgi:WD40 repeat protein